MTISVCVPVYRRHDEPNIGTLGASIPAALGGQAGELVVALNGIGAAEAGVPGTAVITDLGVNRGVAPGWNAAARVARGEVLVFTNDDVVLGEGSLAVLAEALERAPGAGVAGPLGTRWDLRSARHRSWLDLDGRARGDVEECDVVTGWLFATPREVFEQAGGFDERYAPCSFEEVDYCTAVRTRLGLRCFAVAGVDHEHGQEGVSLARQWTRVRYDGRSETLASIQRRNRRYFRRKWAGTV